MLLFTAPFNSVMTWEVLSRKIISSNEKDKSMADARSKEISAVFFLFEKIFFKKSRTPTTDVEYSLYENNSWGKSVWNIGQGLRSRKTGWNRLGTS